MKSGSKKGVEKKRQIVMEEREQAWYIPPSKGIPVYKADNDPNCPAARVRKFNEEQKQKIKQEVRSSAKTEQWVKTALDRQYSNAPLRNIHDFRAKAAEYTKSVPIIHTQGQVSEISILQQIIVRENLLNDLFKICRSNNDLYPIISEITELIKAIRYETLDVIENIADWQAHQPVPRPFIFKGVNYLIKMRTDMDFLDQYDEIVEKFCFEFRSNPLAYRGGGTVITGFDYALSSSQASMNTGAKQHFNNLVQAYQTSLNEGKNGENMMVDGISLIRLHNAEKVIQNEFNRIMLSASRENGESPSLMEKSMNRYDDAHQLRSSWETAATFDPLVSPGEQGSAIMDASSQASLMGGASQDDGGTGSPPAKGASQAKKAKKTKLKNVFNPKRAKLERIAVLENEASELEAMVAHIHEKISTLSQEVRTLTSRGSQLLGRQREARENGKEGAAMHIGAEISLVQSNIQDTRLKIKDLHRESYFIQLERRRKLGVVKQMKDEMTLQREREKLKKKIEAKIKKDGLIAALQQFDGEKLTVDSLKLGPSKRGSDASIGSRSTVSTMNGRTNSFEQKQTKHGELGDRDEQDEIDNEGRMADLRAYNAMIDAHEHIEDMEIFVDAPMHTAGGGDLEESDDDGRMWGEEARGEVIVGEPDILVAESQPITSVGADSQDWRTPPVGNDIEGEYESQYGAASTQPLQELLHDTEYSYAGYSSYSPDVEASHNDDAGEIVSHAPLQSSEDISSANCYDQYSHHLPPSSGAFLEDDIRPGGNEQNEADVREESIDESNALGGDLDQSLEHPFQALDEPSMEDDGNGCRLEYSEDNLSHHDGATLATQDSPFRQYHSNGESEDVNGGFLVDDSIPLDKWENGAHDGVAALVSSSPGSSPSSPQPAGAVVVETPTEEASVPFEQAVMHSSNETTPPPQEAHLDEGSVTSVTSTESKSKAARGTGFSFARLMRRG